MIFRIRFRAMGGHVRCRLFVAPAPERTFAYCGEFTVLGAQEFDALMQAFNAEFVKEDS